MPLGPPGGSRTRHSLKSGPVSNIAVVFVVAGNSECTALKKFTRLLDAPNTPSLELPHMDIGPRLIDVTQRRLADS